MASSATHGMSSPLVVVGDRGGVTVIDQSTPLKRLNYFDGKLLRAADFDVEQQYLRHLVALSNQGLGSGVVYGYSATLGSGDTIEIGPGLAIDPAGNVLLLQSAVSQNIQALIEASRRPVASATGASGHTHAAGTFNDCVEIAAPPPTSVIPTSDIYVIAICTAEAMCGQADVFGKLCEEACVTSTDRPYRLEGVVLRAIPLQLVTPFPTSNVVPIGGNAYLRSKVAHSWFADETRKHPDAISRAGLLSDIWCLGSSYDSSCCEVPLAVVARAGSTTIFLDSWIVRRERMDAPARRYWQWNMRMRPWDVFLAQILQFQCQLADLLAGAETPGGRDTDPCASSYGALREASDFITRVRSGLASARDVTTGATLADRPALLAMSMTEVTDLQEKIRRLVDAGRRPAATNRILIRLGIIELPPAGYLPVHNGSDLTVNEQVRALLGDGLDLRFCVTTADYIAHAIEEAQHMDRISLLQGLDDPSNKPHVDIFVPDGTLATGAKRAAGLFDATLTFSAEETGGIRYRGAAREEVQPSGGTALSVAAAGLSESAIAKLQTLAKAFANPKATAESRTVTPNVEANTFVTTPATVGVELDHAVNNTASSARMFTTGPVSAATRKRVLASDGRLAASRGSVDGLWLTASSGREWQTLGVGEHAPASLRAVIGSRPASPVAIELTFNGTLSITGVAAGPVLTGTLGGIIAVGILKEGQPDQQATEYVNTERINWPVVVTYAGDEVSSTIALDVTLGGDAAANGGGVHLRLLKATGGAAAPMTYQADVITGGTETTPTLVARASTAFALGRLRLMPNPDVINASNPFHQYAESGLEIVQAALINSEPNLKANAEAVLFPAEPVATGELRIEAVRDWVAFARRREKRCAPYEAPPPPVPARTYRVLNVTGKSRDEAQRLAETLAARLHDQTTVVATIQNLLLQQERLERVPLLVRFAGGRATAESDLTAAASDWRTFDPGDVIVYAAVGAVGETDATLQVQRLGTFESAIVAESHETAVTKEEAIVPYPQAAVPANADGVMVIVTAPEAANRHALLIHSNWDPPNHFLSPDAAGVPAPSRAIDFADDEPQGDGLAQLIAGLKPNQSVNGVTLATTKAAPDAGATARLQAVLDALAAAGRPLPGTAHRVVAALNTHDRTELTRNGHNPDDFDEAIFLELTTGA